MSLSIALTTALSGLQANQAALKVTSNNVANVNTDGYSRKTVDLRTRIVGGTASGVDISDVVRHVDSRLQLQVRDAGTTTSGLDTTERFLQRVQDLFGQPGANSSIANRLGGLAQSLTELSVAPENSTLRTAVVDAATSVTRQFNDLSEAIQNLRRDADQDLAQAVKEVNTQLETVVRLNTLIAEYKAGGQDTADLEDARDKAVGTIAEYMKIGSFVRDTGEMVIYSAEGRILADRRANTLAHDPSSAFSASVSYAGGTVQPLTLNGVDITGELKDGKMGALIAARDTLLPNLQAELDNLAEQLRDRVNEIHNRGTALPPPDSLTGTRSFTDPASDSLTLSSDVRVAVVDTGGNLVNAVRLAAGTYTVEEVRDAINAGLGADVTATTGAEGGLSISAGAGDNGIAIADLGDQSVGFGGATYQGFSNFFGLNDLFVAGGRVAGGDPTGLSAALTVRDDIVADPARLARGALDPAATSGLAVASGDNGIALALAESFDQTLSFKAAGDLALTRTSLAGYAGEIVADASLKAQTTGAEAEFQRSMQQELSFRSQSFSGVNLDEELSRLIVFQNAYQASARIVTTAQQMFDVLDQLVR